MIRRREGLAALAALICMPAVARADNEPLALAEIIELVDKHYLYPIRASGASVDEVLHNLDASSKYYDASAFQRLRSGPLGAGTGLSFRANGGDIVVVRVDSGSSADNAHIHAGDVLVAIDDQPLRGGSLEEVVDQLRGDEGSIVRVTTRRGGDVRMSALLRTTTRMKTVVAHKIEDVGYVAINNFANDAGDQFAALVRQLRPEASDSKGFVLDLRDCPGGLFDQAVTIADYCLDGGPIGFQRYRAPTDVERYTARRGDIFKARPLVVLINARTAAGAEFVAGALQDRGRATIVGMPSFGSGLLQTVIPLSAGQLGALKLTTSAWYRPSGRPIQKLGIDPDVLVARDTNDLEHQFRERDIAGALDAPALEPLQSTPAPTAPAAELPPRDYPATGDFQLDRALRLLRA